MNIVIYGAGAIGSTLAGWLSEHHDGIYLLARGKNAEILRSDGLTLYEKDIKNSKKRSIKVITDLNEVKTPEIVIITVKNYSLEEVAKEIHKKLNDSSIIVSLQNGTENQKILPKYFSKVIYGVVIFSAWYDKPGVFGNRGKGQLLLGTLRDKNLEILEKVNTILKLGVSVKITKRLNDAVHSKLILNIGNSIFTLISSQNLTEDGRFKVGRIFVYSFLEGIEVLKKAGYNEHILKGFPSWKTLEFAKNLNKKMALEAFDENMKYSWFNSMAQDMIILKRSKSELESINGYFIELANKHNLDVPINRTLFELCKEEFNKKLFKPLDVDLVLSKLNEKLQEKIKLE